MLIWPRKMEYCENKKKIKKFITTCKMDNEIIIFGDM